MAIVTFNEDLFELEDFSKRLEKFIQTEHRFVDGGLVISLNSKYGTGKTTFLNMWRSAMIAADDKKRIVVYLNAWESDYIGDPLFSIISALTHTFEDAGKDVSKVVEAAKDIGWFFSGIGSQLATKVSGVNVVEAGDLAKRKKGERNEVMSLPDAFTEFEKRKAAMALLKKAIQDLIGSNNPTVLFLVDELDRCRPDYAITYLETIKHIFDISGAVFILAADKHQLENSARTAFGKDLVFDEYYRKFVHREVALPALTPQSYRRLTDKYVNDYLVDAGKRISSLKIDDYQAKNISGLITSLNLTTRQIQEIFRTLGHLCETLDQRLNGKLEWCRAMGSVAMSVFRVGAPDIYHKLGTRKLLPAEAVKFIKDVDSGHADWWFTLFFTGDGLNISEVDNFNSLINQLIPESSYNNTNLNESRRGWGYNGANEFPEIYRKLQQIDQWI